MTQHQTFQKLTELMNSCLENQCCADCSARLNESIWTSITVGAFLCIRCAGAHRKLGVQLSRVKSFHLDTWTEEEVVAMKGGNKHVSETYSKYLDKWIAVDASLELLPNTVTEIREKCIRAKYETKQFMVLPNLETCSKLNIQDCPINLDEDASHARSSGFAEKPTSSLPTGRNQRRKSTNPNTTEPIIEKAGRVVEVTKRFLNYFVVVGRGPLLSDQSIERTKCPTEIRFFPAVLDMFPETYGDSPLPAHVAEFAFPQGFALSKSYAAPVFFSFVLTNMSGVKIYACALKFYEELHPLEVVSLIAPHYHRQRQRGRPSNGPQHVPDENNDNQRSQLPKWVQDLSGDAASAPGPVFCPKCIVVMSHYAYFSAFRQFLQQIYRVTLAESPMPIERYIANFLVEVPLPPPGQIQVQLTLPAGNLIISRPPKNKLPLVDFPFRPLFQVLDLNNVLLVFTCVALELKVVLCSKHIGLLTPVAEALLSLLLPFSWQGVYIPVLPISLLDVIDAPVPFLVGTHSDCLKQAAGRATYVIFVDLDHNRVIPAVDESGRVIPVPKIPDREGSKLRVELADVANIFDPYAAGIGRVDLAFPNEEHLIPIGDYAPDHGQTIPLSTSYSESSMSDSLTSHYSITKMKRGRRASGAFNVHSSSLTSSPSAFYSRTNSTRFNRHNFPVPTPTMSPTGIDASGGLTDSRYNEADHFSTERIRKAFLRFFVTLLKKYASYLQSPAIERVHETTETSVLFDSKRFLHDNFDTASRPFVAQLIATQMFDRFLEDRVFNQQLPEVLFFDQSISQKLNRSLTLGKKKFDCSFLEDRSDEIQETYIAPPPSNIGLPDDGTVYKYKAFPRLKKALFGNVRKPRELYSSREQQRNVSRVSFHQGMFKTERSIISSGASWEATRHFIISVQTQFRMYRAQKSYRRQRNAAVMIQRRIVARMKGTAERKLFIALKNGATVIQNVYRTYNAMKNYREQHEALLKLQFVARGYIVRVRYLRVYRGLRCLQALWRGTLCKRSYKNLKKKVVLVQSRVRGFLSRTQAARWKANLFHESRQQVYDLWDQCETPLFYRSKFWLTYSQSDYFAIAVLFEEAARLSAGCNRMKATLSFETDIGQDVAKTNETRQSALTSFKRMMSPRSLDPHKTIGKTRIKAERSKLYEGLKYHTRPLDREKFYTKFGISLTAKRKKRTLAALVWTSNDTADISAELVVFCSSRFNYSDSYLTQVDHRKQLRVCDNLAFTINAAFKSIGAPGASDAVTLNNNRAVVKLQHQLHVLTLENQRLTDDLAASRQEARDMRRELVNLQQLSHPQRRRSRSF